METEFFFQFEIVINVFLVALSDSFEYQYYGSATIINTGLITMFTLTRAASDFSRQNMTLQTSDSDD